MNARLERNGAVNPALVGIESLPIVEVKCSYSNAYWTVAPQSGPVFRWVLKVDSKQVLKETSPSYLRETTAHIYWSILRQQRTIDFTHRY